MPRNGSGVHTMPAGTTAVPNSVIESNDWNSVLSDVSDALTDSVNVDGTAPFQANQPMGSHKLTGLVAGTTATDSATLAQVQSDIHAQATVVGGTVDAITLTFSPVYTAYISAMRIRWVSGGANTVTNPTIAIDGMATKTVKTRTGAALAAGDLGASGTINEAVYNGTDFLLVGAGGSATAILSKGANVASAGTVTLVSGAYQHITGTTTITDIDFSPATDGAFAIVEFDGALTLTHNATTLKLPTGINITTAAGHVAGFVQDSGDNVRCVFYTGSSGAVDRQTFNADGTWNKPAGTFNLALIEAWGGGGSGGNRTTTGNSGGGGGGAYVKRLVAFSSLGSSETVDIGAGGTAVATSNANGNDGANTTFGTWVTAYGGRGGTQNAAGSSVNGGTGAGPGGVGGTGPLTGGAGGGGDGIITAPAIGNTTDAKSEGGGGAGGGLTSGNAEIAPGKAVYGGGGGGSTSSTGPVNGTGGTSQFGGAGGNGNGTTPTAGAQPGGGGGAGRNGVSSGAGGDGRVIVTCW